MTSQDESARLYLVTALERFDVLLQCEVNRWRQELAADQKPHLKGVFISDGEVDQLLYTNNNQNYRLDEASAAALSDLENHLEKTDINAEAGLSFSLPYLTAAFHLSTTEKLIVLICLAPEISSHYERLYGYLQDDITRKQPSPDLIARILGLDTSARIDFLRFWTPASKLIRSRLILLKGEPARPLLTQSAQLNPVVKNLLLNFDLQDTGLAQILHYTTTCSFPELRWSSDLVKPLFDVLCNSVHKKESTDHKLVINLYGPEGTGRKSLASALCNQCGTNLIIIDIKKLLGYQLEIENLIADCFLPGMLRQTCLLFENFDSLMKPEYTAIQMKWKLCAEFFPSPIFITSVDKYQPAMMPQNSHYMSMELPCPAIEQRLSIWLELAAKVQLNISDNTDWELLSSTFALTPGKIRSALQTAQNTAIIEGQKQISTSMLYKACYNESNQSLIQLAYKVTAKHKWEDLVLPASTVTHLKEICGHLRHRSMVYNDWGFGKRLSSGKGVCVLFHGPSGTGKTLAIEIIAGELHMEAFKIDLSTVVSKYIGETEKNLNRIFKEAETSNAILFFDEADALFGKRSEVKDAHDRYANIEINYLLQRMEIYDGPVFLATNARKNIDDAFFRRMQFAIEFPLPDESLRFHLWKRHIPEQAPVSPDVDFDFLARRFSLSGGNIKNIVVNAAFLAAGNSRILHMEHFIQALRREYEKIGLMLTENDIRPYSFVKPEIVSDRKTRNSGVLNEYVH
jgi:SpoVK/Ycf46/Vps4 family AAA+-type ATPase